MAFISLSLWPQVICAPSLVTEPEAKQIVLLAPELVAARTKVGPIELEGFVGKDLNTQDYFFFVASASNAHDLAGSGIQGYFAVNKRTASAWYFEVPETEPIRGSKSRNLQQELRKVHCITEKVIRDFDSSPLLIQQHG